MSQTQKFRQLKSGRILNRDEKPGWVYFIRHPNGLTKIGMSTSPTRRLEELERQYRAKLKLVHSIYVDDMICFESTFHYMARNRRVYGEWFILSDAILGYLKGTRRLTANDEPTIAVSITHKFLIEDTNCVLDAGDRIWIIPSRKDRNVSIHNR